MDLLRRWLGALSACVGGSHADSRGGGRPRSGEAAGGDRHEDPPEGKFVLTPLQERSAQARLGHIGGNWQSIPVPRRVCATGRASRSTRALWTFTGKRGSAHDSRAERVGRHRERVNGDASGQVAIGTWKVVRGTGQYARSQVAAERPRGSRQDVERALRGLPHGSGGLTRRGGALAGAPPRAFIAVAERGNSTLLHCPR